MNKAFFLGRTTKDIEIGATPNGKTYGKFSIAVDSGFGDNKKTNFFNMTVWGKTAENMGRYVPKGTKIFLECEPQQNTYTNKEGQKVNTVDFRVITFEFCEGKKTSGDSTEGYGGFGNDDSSFIPAEESNLDLPEGW